MTRENLNKLKEHIKKHVSSMNYLRNPEGYGYFIGLIRAYNMVEPDDQIKEIPDVPDAWLDDLMEHQKNHKKNEIEVIKPKIVMPGEF